SARELAERIRRDSERELTAVTAQRDAITAQLGNVRTMLASVGGGSVLGTSLIAAAIDEPQAAAEEAVGAQSVDAQSVDAQSVDAESAPESSGQAGEEADEGGMSLDDAQHTGDEVSGDQASGDETD